MPRSSCSHLLSGLLALLLTVLANRTDAGELQVDRRDRVRVPGAALYLEVRGRRPGAPVLLWLHGGPGGAERPLFRLFNGDLERDFRVAYLDQRGAGRSIPRSFDPASLTVERHLADLDLVVDHLRASERVGEVIIVGHSWGSLLGLLYAARQPEKVSAVVAIAPDIVPLENQLEQHRFVQQRAQQERDRDALRQLAAIGQPPLDGRAELRLGRLVDRFGGTWHRPPNRMMAMIRGIAKGVIGPLEIPKFIRANERSVIVMTPELLRIDLRRTVPALETPVIFFVGRHDHQVSGSAAVAYLKMLRAPSKSLRLFEQSAHNIPFEEPRHLSTCLVASLPAPLRPRVGPVRQSACPYADAMAGPGNHRPAAGR